MRIAFLAMGGSVHTRRWVTYFRDQGHELMLMSFYPCDEIDGIRTEYLPARNRLAMLPKLPRIRRLLSEFKPDLLHAHYASSCGFMAALSGFRPAVLSTWGDDVMVFPHKSPLHRWVVRTAIGWADRVTATSQILARHTEALVNNKRRVKVIPFGVDLDRFRYEERPVRDTVHIGTVRVLSAKYGIKHLLRACATLSREYGNLQLTIVGSGPHRKLLERTAAELGIGDSVTFTGWVPNRRIDDYLRGFDLFVMPSVSRGETFGVAAVEAMATGLPVVASRIGGLPEVVEDDRTGCLVEPGDAESLRRGLQRYILSPSLRREHGRNARAHVEDRFDWQKNAAHMARVYEELVEGKYSRFENEAPDGGN